MNRSRRSHNFIVQGSILAMAGIFCRLIGMLYRIPLIEIIGTVGNGYYTSAYSIYNILLIISSYSLPIAISKIISVRIAEDRYGDVRTALRVAFLYATIAGGSICMLLWFGADAFAVFMKKPFCAYALKTLAPTIWIMAYLGVLRGYFQGTGNMVPTAVSQIFEQIVNAVVSVVMAAYLFDYGLKANILYDETQYSYAFGAAGGTLGTGAGALTALLFFLLLMLLYGNGDFSTRSLRRHARSRESAGRLAKVLLLTLLPILISSTVYNISTVLDDLIFSRLMDGFGLGASVVLLWGVFGEYRILFNIPVAIANSMGSSVIPSLTNAVTSGEDELTLSKIRLSVQFAMLVSLPACVGMAILAEPICNLLFHSENNTLLIRVVQIGAPAVVLFSLSTITNAVLQGLGYLSEPLVNALIALVVHLLSLVLFMHLNRNIYAVILANTVFALCVCILNHNCIHRHVSIRFDIGKLFVRPLLAALGMGAVCGILNSRLGPWLNIQLGLGRLSLSVLMAVCILSGVLVYLVLLIVFRAFTREELRAMPMGSRIYALLRKTGIYR